VIASGKLFDVFGLPPLSPEHERVMICGSPHMLIDTAALLDQRGFNE
ncbi:ferredoxin--NADP reductase, partial [Marinomonas arenicola]